MANHNFSKIQLAAIYSQTIQRILDADDSAIERVSTVVTEMGVGDEPDEMIELSNGSDLTVQEVVNRFHEWNAGKNGPESVRAREYQLRPFVRQFGSRTVNSLQSSEVDAYLKRVTTQPTRNGTPPAQDTCRQFIGAYRKLQNWAVEKGYIQHRLIDTLTVPRSRERNVIPSPVETEQILAAAPDEFRLVYDGMRKSGLYPREISRVRISDVDWDNSRVKIPPKPNSRAGRSDVPLNSDFAEVIRESIGKRKSGLVFRTVTKRQWTTSNMSCVFKRLRRALHLRDELCLTSAVHEYGCKVHQEGGLYAVVDAKRLANIKGAQRYERTTTTTSEVTRESIQVF